VSTRPPQSIRLRLKRKNYWLLVFLCVGVMGMFGFGYAMVPLYNVLCSALGINGKTGGPAGLNMSSVDKSRQVIVQFITTRNGDLPWKFYPKQRNVKIYPGANTLVHFYAENDSDKTMVVQAIPSVAPGTAAKYLKKTECFCFNQQTFRSKESMDMPVLFHIDPALPKNVHTITLSYTLFDVTDRAKRPLQQRSQYH